MKQFNKFPFYIILFITFFSSVVFANGPVLKKETFKENRDKYMRQMDGGIAVFVGNNEVYYSEDSGYPFVQNKNFYYLSGYNGVGASFILVPGKENKFILFLENANPYLEFYNGFVPTLEELKEKYGADEIYYSDKFDEVLNRYIAGKDKIYYKFGSPEFDKKIIDLVSSDYGPKRSILNSYKIVEELRLIKSPEEIEILQKAVDITCSALIDAYKTVKPGINERDLQATIEYYFRTHGSDKNAFASIVASGKNSCTLHYHDNDQVIERDKTIVLDVGSSYQEFASDVTRTIPSSGKFTKEQKEIYNIVYEAQKQAIEIIKPGIQFNDVHDKTFEVIENALYEIGLVKDKSKNWQTQLWYPHTSSHWVGLDTHDAGSYTENGTSRILKPGMVFSVEPGVYIGEKTLELAKKLPDSFIPKDELKKYAEEIKPVYEKYKNIGVRLEDDLLVTETGYKNLSEKAPRDIEEIEKIMSAD